MDDETEGLYTDVEDIMCDQVIISTELDVDFHTNSKLTISVAKLQVAAEIITRTVFPAVVGVYYAYLKNQKTVVENVKRQVFPAVLAFLANSVSRSLSSVQRGITYPLTLKQILVRQQPAIEYEEEVPEKCVECSVLYEPEEKVLADVIFIHGLHGSLLKTWKQGLWRHDKHRLRHERMSRSKSVSSLGADSPKVSLKRTRSETYFLPSKVPRKNDEVCIADHDIIEMEDDRDYSPCWPKDWLPKDCPVARVIAINYTTDPYLWRPVWMKKKKRTDMVERSKEMLRQLLELGVGDKPIIWVGHSKGGLFIKQLILESWENQEQPELKNFHLQTKAIMFYSVPHKGSLLADFTLPLLRRSVELTEIQRNCPFVLDLHKRFLEMLETSSINPEIFSFIETSYTLMSFVFLRIVAFDSADPRMGVRCGVPLDHREICKPAGRDCFLYVELLKLINNAIAENA